MPRHPASVRLNRFKIDQLMTEREWTPDDLATALGISGSGLAAVLTGSRGVGPKVLLGLNRLGLSLDEYLAFTPDLAPREQVYA